MNLIYALAVAAAGMWVAGILVGFYAFFWNMKLYFYLKKINYILWRTLTMLGPFGPGANNPFRWLPYLWKKTDEDDVQILRYKDTIKRAMLQAGFIFAASIVLTIMLVVMITLKRS